MAIDMAFNRGYLKALRLYFKSLRQAVISWKLLPGIVYAFLPLKLRTKVSQLLGKYVPELIYIQY